MIKRFVVWFGLGVGLVIGGSLVYAFFISEMARLVMVGLGAFLLAAVTIGGTALAVNRQWTNALGAQTHRTTHNHRYPPYPALPSQTWDGHPPWGQPDLLPPRLPVVEGEMRQTEEDEIVA
jgi:hypothetical protein